MILSPTLVEAQDFRFWGNLEPGGYGVGYRDTIVYNSRQNYSFAQYEGPKPHFVGIWFPIQEDREKALILYEDYLNFAMSEGISDLRDSLIGRNNSSLLNYGIVNKLDSWEDTEVQSEDFALLEDILKTGVNARRVDLITSGYFPMIVYHHGMGGTFEENSVLFEYLASKGFVIVSSNYHWPGQGISVEEIQGDLEFVLDFGSRLPFIDNEKIYFLGHSWGTQVGLVMNQRGAKQIKTYFLLDTTLELMRQEMVGRVYPQLDSIFRNHPNDFETKTFVITSMKAYLEEGKMVREPLPTFEPFKLINTANFSFIITDEILNHEGFTSSGVIKAAYADNYDLKDSQARTQFVTYHKLCEQLFHLINTEKINDQSFFKEVIIK